MAANNGIMASSSTNTSPAKTRLTIHAKTALRLSLIFVLAGWQLFASSRVETAAQDTSPETKPRRTPAQWITSPGAPIRDLTMLHFRKELDMEKVPEHFLVDVSADNRFLLEVNQERIGSGPARGDLAHWRYEVYDLAPHLHAGKNVLAATVWNLGTLAPVAQISNRTGFLLRGEGEIEQAANTNDSWWSEEEPGFQAAAVSMSELHGYYAADPIEKIDARLFDWTWDGATSTSSRWKKAETIGPAAERGMGDTPNNWQLVRDPLPAMEWREMPGGRVVRSSGLTTTEGFPDRPVEIEANQKVSILLDNGELTTAFTELAISGGKDASIRVTYAEALKDERGEKGNRNEIAGKKIIGVYDEYVADGADNRTLKSLVWRTWRYLQFDIETHGEALQLRRLHSWFTAFPFQQRARFHSDDPALSSIWDVGWRTARLDAHETYMDTPYWEQLQYIGDTRIQALVSFAVAGDDRLARQAVEAFDDSRIPDGITLSRYPTNHFQAIPTFSLLWVGMLHDFAMYRSDPAFVREHLPGTRAVLDWYVRHQNENGLVGRLPWWNFIDWANGFQGGNPPLDEHGDSAVIALHFVMALREAAELEALYGDKQRAERYLDVAARAVQGVQKLCWNKDYGLFADTPTQLKYSQHTNLMAVLLDVVPKEQQREVMTKVLSASDAGFKANRNVPSMEKATYYYRFYLAHALEHAGMGDRYLELLDPWKEMLGLGLTTWAETPEPTRSDSHAWSAHPNYDLLTIVAGIRPAATGFEKVVIEPHLGKLQNATASFPWKDGEIQVDYKLERGAWTIRANLPTGLSGELVWQGKKYPLHSGSQMLTMASEVSSAR
jgi:alpha-L-rhamnosidase